MNIKILPEAALSRRAALSSLAITLFPALNAHGQSAQGAAANFPDKPIRMVVGFPPGGPTDIMARAFADRLAKELKGTVIVDNRPGAGTTIAADLVARSAPDGYTLLVATLAGQGLSPSIYHSLRYDPIKDFAAVTHLTSVPNMLVVNPKLPVNSVQELIQLAKQKPGQLNAATAGVGTSQQMGFELFRNLTGVNIAPIDYKGSAPAIVDLLAGQVQIFVDNTSSVGPYVQAGRLRALAVTSRERLPAFPDLPTMIEAGVPDYEIVSWYGIIAPSNTPKDIVQKISDAGKRFTQSKDYLDLLAKLGATPVGSTPAEFDKLIRTEIERWAPIIKKVGIKQ